MNWEHLTSHEFEDGVAECGNVCLLPFGVLEKHGDHLPLGQDMIYIHDVATRAAEKEPAMVFPRYYFGQILEAKHVPGTIAVRPKLLLPLLENVCDEIARNGFRKIIIVNGHGGNNAMLSYFVQTRLAERPETRGIPDYSVYVSSLSFPTPESDAVHEAAIDSHGGETETSCMQYLHPDLVHPERWADYGEKLGRLDAIRNRQMETGIWWYADFPGHFAANAKPTFSAEKGKVFVEEHIDHLVDQIRAVKADRITNALETEFFTRSEAPRNQK